MIWDWPRPVCPVGGVLLLGYQQAALTQIAGVGYGQGYEAPYVLVTTVPEPSSLVALGVAMASLWAVLVSKRRKRVTLAMALTVLSDSRLATCAPPFTNRPLLCRFSMFRDFG